MDDRYQPHGDMPIMTAHNDMIARVLERHELNQVDLAFEAQLSESTITRVVQGRRPVTPEIIRALWELTRDPEIPTYLFGDRSVSVLEHRDSAATTEEVESAAVRAFSRVICEHGLPSAPGTLPIERMKTIDHAFETLSALRARLVAIAQPKGRANPFPNAKPINGYRAVSHDRATGQHLNTVA